MYLVTIENNGVETVINEVSTNSNNRISWTIKQGINTINSFTFTILPNNEGYNLIQPLKTLVKVLNTKTNKYEFIGRVLSPTHSMDSNGLISKSYVCESEIEHEGTTIHCAKNRKHGEENLLTSLANSCNTSFCNIGLTLNITKFQNTAKKPCL